MNVDHGWLYDRTGSCLVTGFGFSENEFLISADDGNPTIVCRVPLKFNLSCFPSYVKFDALFEI